MNSKIKNVALHAIQSEAESVATLADFINDDFENAVKVIHQSKGRVVISGIGKSAIIAQKIAATLNSTGTAALFMHAADAIHGDLGMVQKKDIVIVVSKSGESPEIKLLTPLIKNFGNTLIAILGNMNSYLANHADIILNTTVNKEACLNNLAPTSSTTVQMVMGDALAICLMELNGFTGKDFARYHPGGNLGKRLYLRVNDIYKQNEKPKVFDETSLKEIIIEISQGRLGATAVLNKHNKIIGIITDGDVRRMLEKTDNLSNIIAADILTANPKTIQPDAMAIEALETLRVFDISQLIVTDAANKYLGIIHLHDLLKEGII
ncbi:MAG: KpsF/GutQ family sugar-phosphate isomerase [Chitinophagaceae bacterium]